MKDYFGYQNKICVITGAASGIGYSTTKILKESEAIIYAIDRNPVTIKGIKKFIQADLSLKSEIDSVFSEIPNQIDCYFNCAGVSGMKNSFNDTFTINYIVPSYILNHYLLDRIKPGGCATIVSSAAGLRWENYKNTLQKMIDLNTWEEKQKLLKHWNYNNLPGVMAYSLSFRAVNQQVATTFPSFSKKGIRLNSLLASCTDTGLKSEFEKAVGGSKNFLSFVGLANRPATPEEIAKPLIFLNSNMATFMTGNELLIDYGNNALIKAGLKTDSYHQSNFYFHNWMIKQCLHFFKKRFSYEP